MKADLHLHTYYSDGTDSPFEVIKRAAELHFTIVSVTDHDTLGGIREALEAGKEFGVQVVPGVEITAKFHQHELHLLAYFPYPSMDSEGWQHPSLVDALEYFVQCRFERAQKIVHKLNLLGINLKMIDVETAAKLLERIDTDQKRIALGRPHIAAALLARDYVSSIDEAFSQYLKKGCPAWVDRERISASEIIHLVHQAGGIVALAHPGLLKNDSIPSQLLKDGIDAIEIYHSRHTTQQTNHFRNWAQENNLLVTGGSDCHGMLKGEPLMGRIEFKGDELTKFFERLDKNKIAQVYSTANDQK